MITQTPGIYIREKNSLPVTVSGVSTAVPAFIGYTEIAQSEPIKIKTPLEFEQAFGPAYKPQYDVDQTTLSVIPDKRFMLADTLELYFRNGGGDCYIISAGSFDNFDSTRITDTLSDAIDQLELKDDITLALIPDLHLSYQDGSGNLQVLSESQFKTLTGKLLNKCGDLKSVFSIFDIRDMNSGVSDFRNAVSPTNAEDLKYGAVYYPWLKTASDFDASYDQINFNSSGNVAAKIDAANDDLALLDSHFGGMYRFSTLQREVDNMLKAVIEAPQNQRKTKLTDFITFLSEKTKQIVTIENALSPTSQILSEVQSQKGKPSELHTEISRLFRLVQKLEDEGKINTIPPATLPENSEWQAFTGDQTDDVTNLRSDADFNPPLPFPAFEALAIDFSDGKYLNTEILLNAISGLHSTALHKKKNLEKTLFSTDPDYIEIKNNIIETKSLMPSQGAVAGIYCRNDRERGIWKSPANLTLQGGVRPVKEVSNAEQDDLNDDPVSGKSVNAIRTFTGKGTIIWGARTLAGNSPEWRYIAVRRFYSYVESSVAQTLRSMIYEPNNAITWVKIKAMITGFLVKQWESGALVGANMREAFLVEVGENTTLQNDINNGIINVRIGLAVARPAEFIIIEFSHQSI